MKIEFKDGKKYGYKNPSTVPSMYMLKIEEARKIYYFIDELIFETIYILNTKGFITSHCCQGHVEDNYFHPYIVINAKRYGIIPDLSILGDEFETEIINIKHYQIGTTSFKFKIFPKKKGKYGNNNFQKLNDEEKMKIIEEVNDLFLEWAKGIDESKMERLY